MKPYTVEIDIELPRDRVIELFDSTENLFKWQKGLKSFEHLSGEPGQPAAKSKMVFVNGKNTIELIETITRRELPDAFDGTYEWSGGSNTLCNRFIEVARNRTRWESTCEYHFRTLSMKLMGLLFASMFRKQNLTFLQNFKAFAEDGQDVSRGRNG